MDPGHFPVHADIHYWQGLRLPEMSLVPDSIQPIASKKQWHHLHWLSVFALLKKIVFCQLKCHWWSFFFGWHFWIPTGEDGELLRLCKSTWRRSQCNVVLEILMAILTPPFSLQIRWSEWQMKTQLLPSHSDVGKAFTSDRIFALSSVSNQQGRKLRYSWAMA